MGRPQWSFHFRQRLKREYNYLIVDSLENASVSESNLITELLENAKESYIFYDKSKDYSSFKNVDITYVEESIIKKFFPEEISNLNEINLKTLYEEKKKIELNENSHLYDEMIESVGDEILQLIKEGKNLSDMVIISPIKII